MLKTIDNHLEEPAGIPTIIPKILQYMHARPSEFRMCTRHRHTNTKYQHQLLIFLSQYVVTVTMKVLSGVLKNAVVIIFYTEEQQRHYY